MDAIEHDDNKAIVEAFYKALALGNSQSAANHLAIDLEWWFHGPPQCQHMMRVLTGELAQPEFVFELKSITTIDEARVIAEGWEGTQAYWVDVWTVKDGLITQFREYFNTWLTVRDLRPHSENGGWEIGHKICQEELTLWQSKQPSQSAGQSMPVILLAI